MKQTKILFIMLAGLCTFSLNSYAFLEGTPHQYTIGANYNLNSQNPFGDFPVLNLSFTLTPSLVLYDIHEMGLNIGYTGTKQSNTIAGTSSTTSTLNLGLYYRYNLTLTGKDAAVPIIGYVGPQFGLNVVSVPTLTGKSVSSSDFSAGGQFGFNFMFTKNLAVNFHALQFDTVFATETQLIITQSLGVRYYF